MTNRIITDISDYIFVSDEPQKEVLAVLMATIGEDLGCPPDQFRIKSVTEVK